MVRFFSRYLIVSLVMTGFCTGGLAAYDSVRRAAAKTAIREVRKQAISSCTRKHSARWCKRNARLSVKRLDRNGR